MIKNLPFLLVVSLLACCVEVDISVPSFPDISNYFNISDGLTQMTVAINFLGFCISSAIYGHCLMLLVAAELCSTVMR